MKLIKLIKDLVKILKRKISVKQKEENKIVKKHIKKKEGYQFLEIRLAKAV